MFSKGSSREISLATVTPSWVTVGAPNFLSSATLRPLGPRVVFTAPASTSMPFLRERRACSSKTSCLAIVVSYSSWCCVSLVRIASMRRCAVAGLVALQDRQDVGLAQDQHVLAVQLEFGAAVLGEEDFVALLHLQRLAVALVGELAGANGDDGALLGLFLGGVGDNDPALGDFFLLRRLDDHAVADRADLARHA